MTQRSETDVHAYEVEDRESAGQGAAAPAVRGDRHEPAASAADVYAGSAPWPAEDVDDVSVLEVANVLLKRWKLVFGFPLLAAVLAAVISLIIAPKYTATATFVPEVESEGLDLPGGLVGLAAQLGVAVPGGRAGSPRFYADVLTSRTLTDQVLLTHFADPRSASGGDSALLLDILEIDAHSEARRLEKGRKELGKMMVVSVDNETNIVAVSVETRYPALSADVANQFVELLNRFNLETRQSSAQERRRFIEERLGEAQRELRTAEDELKTFLERNRLYQGSPELSFQVDRLQRRVTMKQEVLTTLHRQYEEARIQEVNNTPVITVIDTAVPPEKKSSPERTLNVVVALLAGGVLGILGAFGREFMDRARERDEEEFREFASRWAAIKREMRSMVARGWLRRG